MKCSNGGCRRPSSVLIQVGFRRTDERPVCQPCADELRPLFPVQRAEPGVPQWVARLDRNAKILRGAA